VEAGGAGGGAEEAANGDTCRCEEYDEPDESNEELAEE